MLMDKGNCKREEQICRGLLICNDKLQYVAMKVKKRKKEIMAIGVEDCS